MEAKTKSDEAAEETDLFYTLWISVAGVIVAAEDRNAIVEEEENEEEEESDADGRSSDAVDGIGLAGGEDGGDEGAAVGGEELDGEEEDDGKEEEAEGAEEVGDGFGDGLALVAEDERNDDHDGDDDRQQNAVGSAALPFFYHFSASALHVFQPPPTLFLKAEEREREREVQKM